VIDADAVLIEEKHGLQTNLVDDVDEFVALDAELMFSAIEKTWIGQVVVIAMELNVLEQLFHG
jgi:hypothetical protein